MDVAVSRLEVADCEDVLQDEDDFEEDLLESPRILMLPVERSRRLVSLDRGN